jgi:tryptophan synthase alpha chain
MTRLEELFRRKQSNILNVYCTAGYPELDSTMQVMKSLQENGADIIELGMPYSDPLADGPVIQASSAKALANGMSIPVLFDQLKDLRKSISIPVILMGYLNPVLQFGFEKFCERCAFIGIDGLIIPDIPIYEYKKNYRDTVNKHGLDFIFLVTPETTESRIREFDEAGSGFLYAVSASGTTGKTNSTDHLSTYLQRLRKTDLKNPVLVGFGISDKESFTKACEWSHGAIIGSAYIRAIQDGDIEGSTKAFLQKILA